MIDNYLEFPQVLLLYFHQSTRCDQVIAKHLSIIAFVTRAFFCLCCESIWLPGKVFCIQDAVTWLQASESGQAGLVFKEFLERHGHRCIREVINWSANHTILPQYMATLLYVITDQQFNTQLIVSVWKDVRLLN